jgi:hypothetical protein
LRDNSNIKLAKDHKGCGSAAKSPYVNFQDTIFQTWLPIVIMLLLFDLYILQMFIPFNNSLTLKYPNHETILLDFDAKGSILFLFMHVFTAFVQLDADPLKYILS